MADFASASIGILFLVLIPLFLTLAGRRANAPVHTVPISLTRHPAPVRSSTPVRNAAPAPVLSDAQLAILLDAHYKHVLSSAQGRAMWRSLLDSTERPVAA